MTAQRIYQALLRLYPPCFRREYGVEMVETFGEAFRDQGGSCRFWLAIVVDLARSASRERWRTATGGMSWVAMFSATADQRVFRAVGRPFVLGLVGLTGALLVPPMMMMSKLVGGGEVDPVTGLRLTALLVPQGLTVAIPMALLIGVLVGLRRRTAGAPASRLRGRRTLSRNVWPVMALAVVAALATSGASQILVPYANQAYRGIVAAETGGAPGGLGLREMTISDLQARAANLRAQGRSPRKFIIENHQRFAISVACLVFGVIGLALSGGGRKGSALAQLALSIGVIFTYYVGMYGAREMGEAAVMSPQWAMWLPNIVLGALGVAVLVWRAASQPADLDLSGT